MDEKAFKERDELFAARLRKRDESILAEIDRAYAGGLRKRLEQWRGADFSDADIDEILEVVLTTVWLKYDATRKASVRTFYFHVGHARLKDRLKTSRRYRGVLEKLASIEQRHEVDGPDVRSLRIERHEVDAEINRLIAEAVQSLTSRQRLAFTRRFISGDNATWAKDLAAEKGMSAKSWRKASDDARRKVSDFLTSSGVRYSKKGGHYEIVKSRTAG